MYMALQHFERLGVLYVICILEYIAVSLLYNDEILMEKVIGSCS